LFLSFRVDGRIVVTTPNPQRMVWYYVEWQSRFHSIPSMTILVGLPPQANFDGTQRLLLILDDSTNRSNLYRLFSTKEVIAKGHHTHHSKPAQQRKKAPREQLEYNHYIGSNTCHALQIFLLSKQVCSEKVKAFQAVFIDAASFGYSQLDFKHCTLDRFKPPTKFFHPKPKPLFHSDRKMAQKYC